MQSNCSKTSPPAPRVAFCIAGAARSFPTPLIASALMKHFIGGLEASPASRSFLLLKTEDSVKSEGTGDHFKTVHADFTVADIAALFNSSAARTRIQLGSATILRGAGSAPQQVCQQKLCVFSADSTRWKSFRRDANSSRCKSASDNWEMRTLMNSLNIEWCARQISAFESEHRMRFDLVAYSRPDMWWRQALMKGGWCTWNSTRLTITNGDRAWVTPRRHLAVFSTQAELHRSCKAPAQCRLCDCCGGGEYLLGASLAAAGVPVRDVTLSNPLNPLVRSVGGLCESVIGSHYKKLWFHYEQKVGIHRSVGSALRAVFGPGETTEAHKASLASCRSALRLNGSLKLSVITHDAWDLEDLHGFAMSQPNSQFW